MKLITKEIEELAKQYPIGSQDGKGMNAVTRSSLRKELKMHRVERKALDVPGDPVICGHYDKLHADCAECNKLVRNIAYVNGYYHFGILSDGHAFFMSYEEYQREDNDWPYDLSSEENEILGG